MASESTVSDVPRSDHDILGLIYYVFILGTSVDRFFTEAQTQFDIISATSVASVIALKTASVIDDSLMNDPIYANAIRTGNTMQFSARVSIVLPSWASSLTLITCPFSTKGALHSIFCNRLLLNVRDVYDSIDKSISNLSTRSLPASHLPGPGKGLAAPVKLRELKESRGSESLEGGIEGIDWHK